MTGFLRSSVWLIFLYSKCIENGARQFLCVCSVIDHEFRHNIVKVAADYFDNVMMKSVTNWQIFLLSLMCLSTYWQ